MALRFNYSVVVAALDRDGIAVAQQRVGAGDLTLVTPSVFPANQLVSLYSAGNLSGTTFTVYGTAPAPSGQTGPDMSVAIAGPNATTIEVAGFGTVTRVATSGTIASDVEVGWVASGYSPLWPCDARANPFQVGFGCVIASGTPTFSVQHTFSTLYSGDGIPPNQGLFSWFTNAAVDNEAASIDGNYDKPISALRMKVVGAGTVTLQGYQAVGGG